ncbi:MAG: exonuclease domain-containing protein [Pseudolabrys sp.]|nr:exonuclease domain-containing protein [Pseudolabrys sp.]
MSFVFYDTETTGVHKSFDQVLQFAAIRTDGELNELDRFEQRCRVTPYVIPSAGALAVTRVSIDQLIDPRHPSHYEMMCQIASRLDDWTPAVFAGWNSIDFDEHLLRQAFYQCLHKPYATNTNGNCRADILKIAQLAYMREPGAIRVPVNERGAPVFKLDQMAPLNGFNHENAHDALADVEATIFMARLLRDRAPDVWSNALRFSQKAAVVDFVDEEPAFLISEFYFGKPYQFAVTKIGNDASNVGVILALDLDSDHSELRQMTDSQLSLRLHRSPKPIRRVKANSCPGIDALPDQGWHGRDLGELYEVADGIRNDVDFCQRLSDAFCAGASSFDTSEHVEEQLYSGFAGQDDNARMAQFHSAGWAGRYEVVEALDDPRLRILGTRLIYQHAPDSLPPAVRRAEEILIAQRLLGHGLAKPPWLTIASAEAEIDKRLAGCGDEERAILNGLRLYLRARDAEARAVAF